MIKKIFSIIFIFIIAFCCLSLPLTAGAYEVTEFEVTANAGMLISLDTDEILFEKDIDKKVYPASITKIMTTLLILESEKYDPEGKIVMTKSALDLVLGTGSSVSLFKEGEEFTQLDLVYLILMASYGDCAYLAAEYYGGSVDGFVEMMNNKAAELGLSGTHYQNPVGLHHEDNYTSVRDTYTLTKYALQDETFKKVSETSRHYVKTNFTERKTLSTTNFLQDPNTNYYYDYASGVKTGYTDEAGRCVVSTASYNGYNYMCIVMGCPYNTGRREEFILSASLYRWAFLNFSFKEVANSDEPVCEIPLELSLETDFVPLYFKAPFVTILPNGADDSTIVVKTKFKSESVNAPVKKGEVLGTAYIYYAEKLIGTTELVAGNSVEADTILIIADFFKKVFTSGFMKVLYIAIVLAILIFIAWCIRLNIGKFKKRRVKYIPYSEEGKKHEK